MAETMATLRYLAKKLDECGHSYYPKETDAQWQCNSIMDGYSNLMNLSGSVATSFFLGDEDSVKEHSHKLCEAVEKYLTMIEVRMQKHNHKYVTGNSLTCADFCVFTIWSNWAHNNVCPIKDAVKEVFNKHTKLMDWQDDMQEMLHTHLIHRDDYPF